MQLNPEGKSRFLQHLQTVVRKPCAVCDGINWNTDDTIFELRQFAGGGIATGGAIKPVVTVTCQNCGNITFLNALTTGIVRIEANGSAENSESQAAVAQTNSTSEATTGEAKKAPKKSTKKAA